jgi:hypothetical protein
MKRTERDWWFCKTEPASPNVTLAEKREEWLQSGWRYVSKRCLT